MLTLTALLQEASTSWGALVLAALAPIVGWAGSKAFDGFKALLGKYEEEVPAVLKAALAVFITAGLHYVAGQLALDVIDTPAQVTVEWLTAGLSALVALGVKRAEQKRLA